MEAPASPLVTPAWLAERLGDAGLVVLDGSWHMPDAGRVAKAEFAAAHIPGAAFFDIDAISDHSTDLPHMLPSPADFATAARRLGVNPGSTVVVYDTVGLFSAPRVWWTFRTMGHDRVFVLDGGLPAWAAEGHPVETGWSEPAHGEFKAHPRPELVASLADVRRDLETGAAQLVDARGAPRFRGEAPEPRPGVRAGHMPGARNAHYASIIGPDGALKPQQALRAAFEAAGVDLERPIVTTCGSGITASILALALARLDRWDAAVYDGSWSEWGGRSDTPVATGPLSAVAIRFGCPADLPLLDPIDASAAQSFVSAGEPLPDGSPPAPPGHWAGVLAAGLLWIADDANVGPIGFLAGERADSGLYVGQVSVAYEHQRRGLGRRLMQTAIDWARREGLAEVTLETFRTIPWNGPFYASLGFRELAPAELTEHLVQAIALQVSHGFKDRCAMRLEL